MKHLLLDWCEERRRLILCILGYRGSDDAEARCIGHAAGIPAGMPFFALTIDSRVRASLNEAKLLILICQSTKMRASQHCVLPE
jgi:hypothetical protein